MSFLDKDSIRLERRRRGLNSSGIYDMLNFILGICIILTAIFIFIDRVKYEKLFTVVFLFATALNMCMGIKYYHRHEIVKVAALVCASIFFILMMIISFMALW